MLTAELTSFRLVAICKSCQVVLVIQLHALLAFLLWRTPFTIDNM